MGKLIEIQWLQHQRKYFIKYIDSEGEKVYKGNFDGLADIVNKLMKDVKVSKNDLMLFTEYLNLLPGLEQETIYRIESILEGIKDILLPPIIISRNQELNIFTKQSIPYNLQEEIVNACGEFMEALGYEFEEEEEPAFNSFWSRIRFILGKHVTVDEFDRGLQIAKQALELKHFDLPSAEQTEKLASAAEKIIGCLEKISGPSAIRLGVLLVIKYVENGAPGYIVHQLNADQILILTKKPSIIKDFELLTKLISSEDYSQLLLEQINNEQVDEIGEGNPTTPV